MKSGKNLKRVIAIEDKEDLQRGARGASRIRPRRDSPNSKGDARKGDKDIRFIDLFGGVGGFRLGLEKASEERDKESWADSPDLDRKLPAQGRCEPAFNCVGYYDNDKYAVWTYNKNFGEDHSPTDIRGVKSFPDIDLLCAGFPCQSFSVAGRREGFKDTRGTLFFEICRILRDKKPAMVLLENVKGLLSHDEGLTFQVILESLDELGYDAEWEVLNSKHFGVPQNRERVFIIGHLRGKCGFQVFPIGIIGEESNRIQQETGGSEQGIQVQANETERDTPSPTSRGQDERRCDRSMKTLMDINQAQRVYDTDGTSITLKALGGGQGAKTGLYRIETVGIIEESPKPKGNYLPRERVLDSKGIARAVSTSETQHPWYKQDKIRRLTPVECERLQGFPDNWAAGVSDTQRYKQMGNAVTVNVIKVIGERILEVMKR